MPTNVIMPQMGESIAEGTITRWLKKAGDTVKRDEPLFEISTDKVDAEIPSPAAGVLLEILHQEGETVAVNAVVATVGEAGEARATPSAEAPRQDSQAAIAAAPSPTLPAPEATPEAAPPPTQPAEGIEELRRRRSSPLVRSIAKEEGIDISGIEGTGVSGRVTKTDLLAALEAKKAAPAAPPARAVGPVPAAVSFPAGARIVVEPMSPMRRKIAERMVASKMTSAHVSTVFEVDYTAIASLRERVKDRFFSQNGTKLSFLPFIFKATVAALKMRPAVNASLSADGVVYHKDINLGMAVALDWGLIVPVIKRADDLSLVGLARAASDLASRARARKLVPEDVQGGTFTVTNPGVFGSLFGTPVINQPQLAILCVGKIEKRAKVVSLPDGTDTLAIRTMGYLALTFDHRLIDGAEADAFMGVVKATLEGGDWTELEG